MHSSYKTLLPVCVAFLCVFFALQTCSKVRDAESFRPLAAAASQRTGLDTDLILAVVTKESGGDPSARSSVGAIGLMQLKPGAGADGAARLGEPPPTENDLLDPATNLRLGASYLASLIQRYGGNVDVALAAYLKGPEWVKRNGGIGGVKSFLQKPGEIATYVSRIQDLAARLKVRSRG